MPSQPGKHAVLEMRLEVSPTRALGMHQVSIARYRSAFKGDFQSGNAVDYTVQFLETECAQGYAVSNLTDSTLLILFYTI
jgi:hypothetical protein